MTFAQLRYFCSVARNKSVSKASEEMFVTQPAVSTAIRELEKEFKTVLFYRHKNTLMLTREGELFYERANFILNYCGEMENDVFSMSMKRTPLRVGIPPMLSTVYFPSLLERFHKMHPEIPVILYEYGSIRASHMVQNDELDISLINMGIYDIDKFNIKILSRDRIMYYVSTQHHYAEKGIINLEELENEDLIFLNGDSVQNQQLRSRFSMINIQPRIILSSSQLYVICRFLDRNDCGCFLFESMKNVMKNYKGIELEPSFEFNVGFVWKKDKYLTNQMKVFLDYICTTTKN